VVDDTTNAKLKVSFFSLLGLWLFPGDYWIIDLGPDYQYAVVGHPSRKYGWILSRTPTVDSSTLAGIVNLLEAQGYNFADFVAIDQSIHIPDETEEGTTPRESETQEPLDTGG